jgi:S1-C subfamily serine protease
MRVRVGRWAALGVLALAASSSSAQLRSPPSGDPAASAATGAPPAAVPAAPVSLSARKVYEQARSQLVQIRTVLKGRASQTSVGSGFLVSAQGHIITNFHVVSEAALKPDRHDLVYVTADGREAPLVILQLDVLHDLALLRAGDAGASGAGKAFDALPFRPANEPLSQGERIYSLGNPLDVGFTITQGTYNGLVRRSFYPQIFFGGALSAGMSGGPALDEEGHVVGVNVARRVDGEQVSFLVPAEFATALLARGKDAAPIIGPAYGIVGEQLLKHQAALTDRFIAQGWKEATHPRYRVPVPPDVFMRCWGTSEVSRTGGLDFERSECQMDTRVFVGEYTTGRSRFATRATTAPSSARCASRRAIRRASATRRSCACLRSTRPSRAATRTSSSATACRCAPSSACAPTRSCRSCTTSPCWSRRSTRPSRACRAASMPRA